MKKLKNSKGFTLMEMLIVVAIIAILVAIAIPAFSGQLEKAREAADMANIRSAYAEVMAAALSGATPEQGDPITYKNGVWSKDVEATQKQAGWQTNNVKDGTVKIGEADVSALVAGNSWTVSYNETTATTSIVKAN